MPTASYRSVRLGPVQIATALDLGAGNLSAGIRLALDRARRAHVAAALLTAPAGSRGDSCDLRSTVGREYKRARGTAGTTTQGADSP